MIPLSPLGKRHAHGGMDSGVPSTGDFRGDSRPPRSRLPQRRRRPADGCDVRLRSIHRRPARAARLPTPRRGQGQRPEDRARSSSRATTCRSSTRSRSPSQRPRPVHFLAKSSYFDGPGMSGWFSREFFTAIGAVPVQAGRRSGGARRPRPAASAARRRQRGRALPRGHALARRPPLQGPHRRGVPGAPDRRPGRAGRPDRHRQGHARRRALPLAAASGSPSSSVNRSISPTTARPSRARRGAWRPTTSWRRSTRCRARSSRTPTTRLPRTTRSSASSRSFRTSAARRRTDRRLVPHGEVHRVGDEAPLVRLRVRGGRGIHHRGDRPRSTCGRSTTSRNAPPPRPSSTMTPDAASW